MECKNCKEVMEEEEYGQDDDMITLIQKCPKCDWSSKSWYNLDECLASHTAWVNDKKESVD